MEEYTRDEVLSMDDIRRLPSDPNDWLDFCINTLIEDKTITYQTVIGNRLTVEELMGALLACKKYIWMNELNLKISEAMEHGNDEEIRALTYSLYNEVPTVDGGLV